jgi:hypothetical protein
MKHTHKHTRLQVCASQATTTWVFKMYDRLHDQPVDATEAPGKQSGRLAFLKEILREVAALTDIVVTHMRSSKCVNAGKMVKRAEQKLAKIRQFLFGKVRSAYVYVCILHVWMYV